MMRAVVKHSNKPYDLTVQNIEKPKRGQREVLVQVNSVGVCGSDLHMYSGHTGYDWITYPLVLGHEITGAIIEADQKDLIGRRVVINPYIPCGNCSFCKNSQENLCDNNAFSSEKVAPKSLQYGFRKHGGMAEFIVVPEENVIPISEKVSDNVAAVAEALAVSLTAVEKVEVLTGKKAVIFGPGPIGLGIASLLIGLQVEDIVMVGVSGDEKRLTLAKELGVNHTVISSDNIVNELLEKNSGYNMVFDCSGHHSVPKNAVKVLKKGGQLILVGISTQSFSLEMDQVVRGEIQVQGSYGITRETFKRTLDYAIDTNFLFDKLVTDAFSVEHTKDAFDSAINKAAGKIVITFNN